VKLGVHIKHGLAAIFKANRPTPVGLTKAKRHSWSQTVEIFRI